MSLLAPLEAKIESIISHLDGEALRIAEQARDDALAELARVETEFAKVAPLVSALKAGLETALAQAGPAVKAAAEAALEKFLSGLPAL